MFSWSWFYLGSSTSPTSFLLFHVSLRTGLRKNNVVKLIEKDCENVSVLVSNLWMKLKPWYCSFVCSIPESSISEYHLCLCTLLLGFIE